MAIRERNKFATTLHSIVAGLLLLFGLGLVAVGIYLLVSDKGGRLDLDYTGSNFWNFVLRFGIAAIIAGGFLIVASLLAIVAISRRCIGKVFRFVYVIMALVIVGVLVFIATISLLIVDRRDTTEIKDFVRDAWERSVTSDDEDARNRVCEIQEEFNCVGFEDNECRGCERGIGAGCTVEQQRRCPPCGAGAIGNVANGCYKEVRDNLKDVYLPLGIITAVLAAIVLLDTLIVCCI